MRLVDETDTHDLSLAKLREHGLKRNIQGAMKLSGELSDYIMSFFEHNLTEGYYPDEVDGPLEEGKPMAAFFKFSPAVCRNFNRCNKAIFIFFNIVWNVIKISSSYMVKVFTLCY